MKTLNYFLIGSCMFFSSYCTHPELPSSQIKEVSNIPIMNSDEYTWCSRQVLNLDVDSLGKTNNSVMNYVTDSANTEYRNKSKLLIDELLNLITSGKIKAYSHEGTVLTLTDVNNILSEKTNVLEKKDTSKKVTEGTKKQNITAFRIVEDVYLNKKTLKFEVKPLALIPWAAAYDDNGELKGIQPLFYIYL